MSQAVTVDKGHLPDASLSSAVFLAAPLTARNVGVRTASPPLSARTATSAMSSAWSGAPAVRSGLGGSLSVTAVGGSVSVWPADSYSGSFTASLAPASQTRPVRNVVAAPTCASISPVVAPSTMAVGSANTASVTRFPPPPTLPKQVPEVQSPTVVYRVMPSGVYAKLSAMSPPPATVPSPLLAASPLRASPFSKRISSPVRASSRTAGICAEGVVSAQWRLSPSQSSPVPLALAPPAIRSISGSASATTLEDRSVTPVLRSATPVLPARALSTAFPDHEGCHIFRYPCPGGVGGGTGEVLPHELVASREVATPSVTRHADEEGPTASPKQGYEGQPLCLALDIPKFSSAALNAAHDCAEDPTSGPTSSAPTEKLEPVAQSSAETAFEKHVQRTQKARDQRHRDIHCVRISATRWEEWNDPWLDSSSSVRCRRTVIPAAGKGERSALPTPRADSIRKDSSSRDPSGSPRPGVTPRAASPSKLSPRGATSPRARHGSRQISLLSPRSDGKTTKNKRLPGDVLSRCSARCRTIPKVPQHVEYTAAPIEEVVVVAAQERACPRVNSAVNDTPVAVATMEECLEVNDTPVVVATVEECLEVSDTPRALATMEECLEVEALPGHESTTELTYV
eukprot:CAMPEP_0169328058 /NCGR_PEP_ID=MMETSP1017-20121227/12379_1 /TAXON_ID=342587 /ORGANISM="Karlodinium micrum, Strain CCMP2283" /LENGTH=627 /DNA_ID=CAMNT_0009422899 /DNA_START=47 /DNA_END=1930 /DNA_ORIENTATION=+